MNTRYLSDLFKSVAFKRLRMVEINPQKSNQHEFNGHKSLKQMLGSDRFEMRDVPIIRLEGKFESTIIEKKRLQWYDSRLSHLTRSEHRLYYESNSVIPMSKPGDLLVFVRSVEDRFVLIIAEQGSIYDNQLRWMFGVSEVGDRFVHKDLGQSLLEINVVSSLLLDQLGIDPYKNDHDFDLEKLNKKFGDQYPTTHLFSKYAQDVAGRVDPIEDPDHALMTWLETEERLFRLLESKLVKKKLAEGFGKQNDDVDDFIAFSLSIQNKRKSRAGYAFENHLEQIFIANRVNYSRGVVTENRSRPDFIFPSIDSYRNPYTDTLSLRMLGVKTTAKDRWRQILTEAERIQHKHLATLEAGISDRQLTEMSHRNVILVMPRQIIDSVNRSIISTLTVGEFVQEVNVL
jgi:hypothetical protein